MKIKRFSYHQVTGSTLTQAGVPQSLGGGGWGVGGYSTNPYLGTPTNFQTRFPEQQLVIKPNKHIQIQETILHDCATRHPFFYIESYSKG